LDSTNIYNSCGWFRAHYDDNEQRISECITGTPTGYYWGHPNTKDGLAVDGRGTDHGMDPTGPYSSTRRGACYTFPDGDPVPIDANPAEDYFYERSDAVCMCGDGGICERPPATHVRFGILHWPYDLGGNPPGGTSSFANLYIPYWTPIYGCMDQGAENYNPDANFDNDSCEYPPNQPPIISVNITAT